MKQKKNAEAVILGGEKKKKAEMLCEKLREKNFPREKKNFRADELKVASCFGIV